MIMLVVTAILAGICWLIYTYVSMWIIIPVVIVLGVYWDHKEGLAQSAERRRDDERRYAMEERKEERRRHLKNEEWKKKWIEQRQLENK